MLQRGDIDETFNWDESFFNERQFDTTEVSAEQLKRMVGEANIRINFIENYNMRIGRYDRAIKLFEDILSSHPGHLVAQYCIGLAFKMSGNDKEYLCALEKCRKLLDVSGMAREHLRIYSKWLPLLEQIGSPALPSWEPLCLMNNGV
jgi:tetratricopeptide (TPR) repeat protein